MAGTKRGPGAKLQRVAGRGAAPRRARRSSALPRPGALPSEHEVFRQRLSSLEEIVARAVADSGGESTDASWLPAVAEQALDLWAGAARAVEGYGAWAGIGVRARAVGEEDFGLDADVERRVGAWSQALFGRWCRLDHPEPGDLPRGPVMWVANRSAASFGLEYLAARVALERAGAGAPRPLVPAAALAWPVLGDLLARAGFIAATEENVRALLESGTSVLWLAEDESASGRTFRERYRVGGVAADALLGQAAALGVPVVPLAILGGEEAHPVIARLDGIGRWVGLPGLPLTPTFPWFGLAGAMPLPVRWRIEVGAAIELRATGRPGSQRASASVRRWSAVVRAGLQETVSAARRRHAVL